MAGGAARRAHLASQACAALRLQAFGLGRGQTIRKRMVTSIQFSAVIGHCSSCECPYVRTSWMFPFSICYFSHFPHHLVRFSRRGGVEEDVHQSVEHLPLQPIDIQAIKKVKDLEEDAREGATGSTRFEFPRCKDTPLKMAPSPTWNAGPLRAATQDAMLNLEEQDELNTDDEWLERIKREHDLAKAMKLDDAEVPIHIWDEAIFQEEASDKMQESTRVLWMWCLQVYRSLLWDILCFLATGYGEISKGSSNAVWQSTMDAPYKGWASVAPMWRIRTKAGELQPSQHRGAMQEIIWRASHNDWSNYPAGSWLHYF
jgi:hypothetical protein